MGGNSLLIWCCTQVKVLKCLQRCESPLTVPAQKAGTFTRGHDRLFTFTFSLYQKYSICQQQTVLREVLFLFLQFLPLQSCCLSTLYIKLLLKGTGSTGSACQTVIWLRAVVFSLRPNNVIAHCSL